MSFSAVQIAAHTCKGLRPTATPGQSDKGFQHSQQTTSSQLVASKVKCGRADFPYIVYMVFSRPIVNDHLHLSVSKKDLGPYSLLPDQIIYFNA